MKHIEDIAPPGCGCDGADVVRGLRTADQALGVLAGLCRPVAGVATVPLAEAVGRVLAQPLVAAEPCPRFDNAAMDGYAVRSADLRGAGPWTLAVADRATAGDGRRLTLGPGSANRIFTGAPLPQGADAVIMQEEVRRTGGRVTIHRPPVAGQNARRAGEDMAAGDTILTAGRVIGPRDVGVAATAGAGGLAVRRRVRVALLVSGDEIAAPGDPLPDGAIWDANAPMLQAALTVPAVEVVAVARCRDSCADLAALLADLSRRADLVVTTGGVSVGDADHMRDAVALAGGTVALAGVAIKPGKPVCAGALGDAVWLGLPGNPVAAFVTWTVFGRAVLDALCGRAGHGQRRLAVLDAALTHRPGRCEFRPARLCGHDSLGRGIVTCGAATHSARMLPLAAADGLIAIPSDADRLAMGDLVEFLPFGDSQG